jgi:hypothetical protein
MMQVGPSTYVWVFPFDLTNFISVGNVSQRENEKGVWRLISPSHHPNPPLLLCNGLLLLPSLRLFNRRVNGFVTN